MYSIDCDGVVRVNLSQWKGRANYPPECQQLSVLW